MHTPIGQELRESSVTAATAGVIAVFAILADFALVWRGDANGLGRGAIPLVCLAAYWHLTSGDLSSVGLTFRPIQGWRYWIVTTLMIGAVVAVLIAGGIVLCKLAGWELPVYTTPPWAIGDAVLHSCVFAPIIEEATYRLVVCVPAVVFVGSWGAIAVSGAAFVMLHFAYGNPAPDNLIAGFFLAWAFLKSGTIVVPLLWHSIGNAIAVAAHVAAWHWMASASLP